MLRHSSMKTISKIILAVVLITFCQTGYAVEQASRNDQLEQLLDSNKNAKKLEGAMLRLVRPIIKKTPMVAMVEDIDMMVSCPVGKNRKDDPMFREQAEAIFSNYTLVKEINDELSHMYIYITGLDGDRFNELVLYITSPEPSILFFKGDFTVESLMEVGRLSELDRKKRIAMKEQGQDDDYLKHIK